MQKEFPVRKVRGVVTYFSEQTGHGMVRVRTRKYRFDILSFKCNRPHYPKRDEKVDIVLSKNRKRLVSVWSLAE